MTTLKNTAEIMREEFAITAEFITRAPGRVNLIGEHTDYNDGFVLPCAINFFTEVAFCRREDNKIRILAADYDNQIDTFELSSGTIAHAEFEWANYVRGVIDVIQKDSAPLSHGFDMVISGNVPQGAGLSSSASLEVAVAKAISEGFQLDLSHTKIALLAQRAENEFVGCQCGIMDQLISATGVADSALLIDCRSLATQLANMPLDWVILIINSNVRRGLVDSKYNERREQCEQAAKILEVSHLRDATLKQLEQGKSKMTETVYRRARHVISDSQRAQKMVTALKQADMHSIHTMMRDSHLSMRDDFEITHPHVDALVDIVAEVIGEQGGVRMTGGGFGGCIVSLLPKTLIKKVQHAVKEKYPQASGLIADIYTCQAVKGVQSFL